MTRVKTRWVGGKKIDRGDERKETARGKRRAVHALVCLKVHRSNQEKRGEG